MKKIYLVITKMTNLYDQGEVYEYHAFFSEEAANKYASEHNNGQDCEYWYESTVEQIDLDLCLYNGEDGCIVADINILGFLNFINKASKKLDSINLDYIRTISCIPGDGTDTTIVYNSTDNDWPDDDVQAIEDKTTLENRCNTLKEKLVIAQLNWYNK